MTDRGNLVLAVGRFRCAENADSGLVGSRALLGRRVSKGGRVSLPRRALELFARKGLIKLPMLNDSRRGGGDDLLGRRAEPSSGLFGAPPVCEVKKGIRDEVNVW